jgi:hypothetical protein
MRYPTSYKVEGKEVKEFKDLDDDKALKLVVLIYNVKPETWEGDIARSISLQQYIGFLEKRRSQYIKESGIFEATYKKVNIASWKDEDLVKLYDSLHYKASKYYVDASPELNETQNTERIVYLTAISAAVTELKARDNKRNAVEIASRLILGVLTTALAML